MLQPLNYWYLFLTFAIIKIINSLWIFCTYFRFFHISFQEMELLGLKCLNTVVCKWLFSTSTSGKMEWMCIFLFVPQSTTKSTTYETDLKRLCKVKKRQTTQESRDLVVSSLLPSCLVCASLGAEDAENQECWWTQTKRPTKAWPLWLKGKNRES